MLKVELFKIKDLFNNPPTYEKIFTCYDSFELLEREFGIDINIVNDLISQAQKKYLERLKYVPEIKEIPVKTEKEIKSYDNITYLIRVIYKNENMNV